MIRAISSLAMVGVLSAAASAATIVDQNFDGGTSGWVTSGGTNAAVAIVTSPDPAAIDGNTLQYSKTGGNGEAQLSFTSFALDAVGKSITYEADYRYDSTYTATTNARFGLRGADGAGYSFSFIPGAGGSNGGVLFRFDPVAENNAILGNRFATSDPGGDVHHITLTIARTAASELTITATADFITGGTQTEVDTSPATYVFERISLRLDNGANNGPAYLDNVKVTTVVPEPTSMGLLGAGAAMLLAGRRR